MQKQTLLTTAIVGACLTTATAGVASAAYIDVVNGDNPVGFYLLDETGGTTTASDASGNSRDGTYTGFGDLAGAQGNPGIPNGGTSVQFGGNDDHIEFGGAYSGLPNSADLFTLEAWINLGDVDPSNGGFAVSYFRNNTNNRYHAIGVDDSGQAVIRQNQDGVSGSVTGSVDLSDGSWHHIVGVFTNDGTADEDQLYVNGVLVGGGNGPNSDGATDRIAIGFRDNRSGGNGEFPGLIDNVGIYDYALSDTQIAAHYAAGIVIPEPSSVAAVGLLGLLGLRRRR